ncbi:O-antigen ligase family protein [Marinobacter salexigens]|uniref:O-antigen ligase family protein n=1 Tax=Marinobacter salexigens TaxID=1925763 RepID=UPI000C2889CE|nr:O-antigen ligase family protein [Marinobacter salexigens]
MSKFALLFLMVFFGGILSALLFTPVASFLVYQLVYFLNPDIRWWSASIPGIRYSFITVIVMFMVLLSRYSSLSLIAPWKEQPVFKWMLALVALYFISLMFAVVPEVHKRFAIDFAKLVLIVMIAYKLVHTEKALDACLWAYIVGATYIGYMAREVGRDGQGRVEGIGMVDTGGDGNMTAAAMVPALIMLIYLAWLGNKRIRFFALVCGALIANGIVLINSRGAFLGALVGGLFFLFFMIFSKYQRKGQRGTAIFIILVALGGTIYVADELFWARMQTIQEVDDGGKSGSHRIDFWMATFDVVRDYPLGVGIQGYTELSPSYLPEHYFEGRKIGKAVHSTWFQMLSELGWLGLFLLIALLVSTLKLSKRTKQHLLDMEKYNAYFKVLALEGALISFLVAGSFIDRARSEVLYWLILFIAIAANIYLFRDTHQSDDTSLKTRS